MARAPGMTDLNADRAASKQVGALRGLAPFLAPYRKLIFGALAALTLTAGLISLLRAKSAGGADISS